MLKLLVIIAVAAKCIVVEGAGGCVGECSLVEGYNKVQYLRHSECDKYCVCVFGKPQVRQCKKLGEHWSESQELCADPVEAKCQARDYDCIGVCPEKEDPEQAVLLAHDDCTKYCLCKKGRPVVKKCKSGFLFNPKEEMCVIPSESDCTGINGPSSDDAISKGCQIQCPPGSVSVGHHDCDKYCRCKNGWSTVENCPKGLHFSEALERCVDPKTAQCEVFTTARPPATRPPATRPPATRPPATRPPATRPPATRPPPVGDNKGCLGRCPLHNSLNYTVHLPHEECSKFCKCDWGKPYVFECPDHLHFNPVEEVCDYTFNVNCTGIGSVIDWFNNQNIVKVGNSFINKDNLDTDFAIAGEVEDGIEGQEEFSNAESSKNSDPIFIVGPHADVDGCIGKCPIHNSLDYTVHLPHKNCRDFCKCDWGKPYVFECPDDLHFNPREHVCDFPFNVNCTGYGRIEREKVDNVPITDLYN